MRRTKPRDNKSINGERKEKWMTSGGGVNAPWDGIEIIKEITTAITRHKGIKAI